MCKTKSAPANTSSRLRRRVKGCVRQWNTLPAWRCYREKALKNDGSEQSVGSRAARLMIFFEIDIGGHSVLLHIGHAVLSGS